MPVYILHFNKRIGSDKHSAHHYCGFTSRDFNIRKQEHLSSCNVPIIKAFRDQGATFEVGKVWENEGRGFERWLKRTNRNVKGCCLVCREEKIIKKQIGGVINVSNLQEQKSENVKLCGGWYGEPCAFQKEAQFPPEEPQFCSWCYDLVIQDIAEGEAEPTDTFEEIPF